MVEREEERGAGDKVMNVIELENAVNKFVLLPMARGAMIAGRLLLLRMPHPPETFFSAFAVCRHAVILIPHLGSNFDYRL
jgi:hypothetical protein